MKLLVYIYIVLFLTACSNNKVSNAETLEEAPVEFNLKEEVFEYEIMAKQKLQDYFDLLELKESYPEFSEEISSQLQTVVNDTIHSSLKPRKALIGNLQQVGELKIISDTEKRIVIGFDLTSNDIVKRDTLVAIIKTNIVLIDNKKRVATKVSFIEY